MISQRYCIICKAILSDKNNSNHCGIIHTVLKSDEVAVKKEKIKRLIAEIEAYPMLKESKDCFLKIVDDLDK